MSMNIVKSSNERAREEAFRKEQEKKFEAHVRQERLNIRLSLLQITENEENAAKAWAEIKHLPYPEITVFANALYIVLKNNDVVDFDKLTTIVAYLKNND